MLQNSNIWNSTSYKRNCCVASLVGVELMIRMNGFLARALQLYPCHSWSSRHARNQWRYIYHLIDDYILQWGRIICKFNAYPVYDLVVSTQPRRNVGHPRLRWDDHIKVFCWKIWLQHYERHWFDILIYYRIVIYEDSYVLFMSTLM